MKGIIPFVCIAVMLVVFAFMHQPYGSMTSYEIKFWGQKEPDADIINSRFHLDREPALLYLDPGDAPYFFRANSSCRYVCPLPVQRDADGWDLSGNADYRDEYDCIMGYSGKYIVFDAGNHYDGITDWFQSEYAHRLPITRKISAEYRLVYNGSWRIYERIV